MLISPLTRGKTHTILDENKSEAGVTTKTFTIDSDALLVSLWVDSLAGNLDVVVSTFDNDGQELNIITFPTVAAPTSSLQIKKSSDSTLSNIKVSVTYTGAVDYRISVRGLGHGEESASSGTITGVHGTLTTPTVKNLSVSTTEVSYALPNLTQTFLLRARGTKRVDFAYSALATDYITIAPGSEHRISGLDPTATVTIYARTSSGTDTLIIESWQ